MLLGKHSRRRTDGGFSYVGACQVLMGLYMIFSRGLGRLVHSARSLFLREQHERSNVPSLMVLTSKAPREAQSAIRAHGVVLPAHEIPCASDDAHSRSRALEVDSLAQKPLRAIVPRGSLRGPAVQSVDGGSKQRRGAAEKSSAGLVKVS